jgi:sulfate adenylyltransferase large subunit
MAAEQSFSDVPVLHDRPALRVTTAGSVDDGKSTLIGRLLHDSRSLARDQLEQVERASKRRGRASADLSLVTDGLRAEREQGITIDVAWRYFATPARRFVLSDTPGHVQYTRNMVTGASTADVAVVLVDARHGLKDQSRRHLTVASLLGVETIVVAVNKMDLVGWDGARFDEVAAEAREAARRVGGARVVAVPISALDGDNVVERSTRMPFYVGPALLPLLEQIEGADHEQRAPTRLPVQWIVNGEDYRGYAGRVASGTIAVGDAVRVLPSGLAARVARIEAGGRDVDDVRAGESVIVHLDRDVDVSRGDVLVREGEAAPRVSGELEADLVWLADQPARVKGAAYRLKHGTRTVRATLDAVDFRLDMTSLDRLAAPSELGPNDVARVRVTARPGIVWDPYEVSRGAGSFVLLDEATGDTVAAGMLR